METKRTLDLGMVCNAEYFFPGKNNHLFIYLNFPYHSFHYFFCFSFMWKTIYNLYQYIYSGVSIKSGEVWIVSGAQQLVYLWEHYRKWIPMFGTSNGVRKCIADRIEDNTFAFWPEQQLSTVEMLSKINQSTKCVIAHNNGRVFVHRNSMKLMHADIHFGI